MHGIICLGHVESNFGHAFRTSTIGMSRNVLTVSHFGTCVPLIISTLSGMSLSSHEAAQLEQTTSSRQVPESCQASRKHPERSAVVVQGGRSYVLKRGMWLPNHSIILCHPETWALGNRVERCPWGTRGVVFGALLFDEQRWTHFQSFEKCSLEKLPSNRWRPESTT